jgi:hypothetical protein
MTASGSAGRFEYQNGQPVPIRGAALNAEGEPEHEDYPKDPNFQKEWGPRGVIKSSADGRVEDTGPLTKKRMETVDEDFASAAVWAASRIPPPLPLRDARKFTLPGVFVSAGDARFGAHGSDPRP